MPLDTAKIAISAVLWKRQYERLVKLAADRGVSVSQVLRDELDAKSSKSPAGRKQP